MHPLPYRSLCLCLSLLVAAIAFGQSTRPIFEHLTTEHGLSSNKVEAITQDDHGFYWIATQNGLNRFDGTNIRVYTHQPDDSTSLTHNNCTAIAKDMAGDIWVATYNGVSRYRQQTGTFQRIYLRHPTRNYELTNRIYNLAVDSTGNVWIAGNGLWKYDVRSDVISLFQNNKNAANAEPSYAVISQLQYDPTLHGLWMSTGVGITFFNIAKSEFYSGTHNPYGWEIFNHAKSNELAVDRQGRIWFRDHDSQCFASFDVRTNSIDTTTIRVTSGVRQIQADDKDRIWIFYWIQRATIYDPVTRRIDSVFFAVPNERSVLSEQATSLYIDDDRHYWITSGSGISIYREANQYYRLHRIRVPGSLPGDQPVRIQALAQSDSSTLWIGTANGLYTYNLQSGETRRVPLSQSAFGITTMMVSGELIWIGAHDQVSILDIRSQQMIEQLLLEPGIIFIRKDARDHVWIGTWLRGLFELDEERNVIRHYRADPDSLPGIGANNLITALPDEDKLWVGYNAGLGFSMYEYATDTWKHFHPNSATTQANTLPNAGTVTVIIRDQQAQLWIGTHGGGLFQVNPDTETFTHYSQSSGLNSNYINSILPGASGHLWIASADGLNIMDITSRAIRPLDMDLAFRDNDFRQNGITGTNGMLYFFFNDLVIEIDPEGYDLGVTTPRLVISQFTVFDEERQLPAAGEDLILSHTENFFSFGFSAIKTHPSHHVQYAYRIQGFDKDWIYTDRPFANYTNVPHGRYTFQVKAMNENGEWSEPLINIPMRLRPPFWRTWWFMALLLCTITGAIYGIYRYRIEQIRKLMAVRARISRDLHDEVGSALSSIHVYSSVAEKAMDKKPEATRDALRLIHDNSKQVMENMGDIVWAINTGPTSELSLEKKLKNYGFELLTPLGIVTTYSIAPEVEAQLTSIEARRNVLLIAKEAMNNIARYSKATAATIELSIANNSLRLLVTDNGTGFDPVGHKAGNGLYNMRKRTEDLGGAFTVDASPQQGVRIASVIPLTSIRDN